MAITTIDTNIPGPEPTDHRTNALWIVPQSGTLPGFAERCATGVALESMAAGTELVVHTRRTRYEITVLDGRTREVRVRGGNWFPTPTVARLRGATAGGAIRMGWVGFGLKMEIALHGDTIVTSPVVSIAVGRAMIGLDELDCAANG